MRQYRRFGARLAVRPLSNTTICSRRPPPPPALLHLGSVPGVGDLRPRHLRQRALEHAPLQRLYASARRTPGGDAVAELVRGQLHGAEVALPGHLRGVVCVAAGAHAVLDRGGRLDVIDEVIEGNLAPAVGGRRQDRRAFFTYPVRCAALCYQPQCVGSAELTKWRCSKRTGRSLGNGGARAGAAELLLRWFEDSKSARR